MLDWQPPAISIGASSCHMNGTVRWLEVEGGFSYLKPRLIGLGRGRSLIAAKTLLSQRRTVRYSSLTTD